MAKQRLLFSEWRWHTKNLHKHWWRMALPSNIWWQRLIGRRWQPNTSNTDRPKYWWRMCWGSISVLVEENVRARYVCSINFGCRFLAKWRFKLRHCKNTIASGKQYFSWWANKISNLLFGQIYHWSRISISNRFCLLWWRCIWWL